MSGRIAIRVKLFGAFEEIAGSGDFTREIDEGLTVDALWDELTAQWPGLAERDPVRLSSVNLDFASGEQCLAAGDEVAFFPPVSGG